MKWDLHLHQMALLSLLEFLNEIVTSGNGTHRKCNYVVS